MPFIASSIPGRIRIRHKAFAQARRSASLRDALLALDGISSVESNPDSSSVIIRYDAAAIPAEAMESVVDEIVQTELAVSNKERDRQATLNRYAKYGMLLSLAASLVLAAKGSRRAHALAGGLFVAGLGLHLHFHRHRILA